MWGRTEGLPLDNGKALLTAKVSGWCSADSRPHKVPVRPPTFLRESVRRVGVFLHEGIPVMLRKELLLSYAELTQIIAALSSLRLGFGLRKCWQ